VVISMSNPAKSSPSRALGHLWSAAGAVQKQIDSLLAAQDDLGCLLATLTIPRNRELLLKAGPEVQKLFEQIDRIAERDRSRRKAE
jgi:hypothetical protein